MNLQSSRAEKAKKNAIKMTRNSSFFELFKKKKKEK